MIRSIRQPGTFAGILEAYAVDTTTDVGVVLLVLATRGDRALLAGHSGL